MIAAQLSGTTPLVEPSAADVCGSVVVVRCDAQRAEAQRAETRSASGRPTASRVVARPPLTGADASLLDPVVIEAERLPSGPSLHELMKRAARPGGPIQYTTRVLGAHTCSCFEPCVMNCCQCNASGDAGPALFTGR